VDDHDGNRHRHKPDRPLALLSPIENALGRHRDIGSSAGRRSPAFRLEVPDVSPKCVEAYGANLEQAGMESLLVEAGTEPSAFLAA